MKKVLWFLLIVCAFVATSCTSDNEEKALAQLNFAQARYTLAKTTVDVKLIADRAPSTTISVPVSFAGVAVKGVDFIPSAEAFTLKAGETEAVISLTRVVENIGDIEKELIVNLKTAPEGYVIGAMNYTSVELFSNNAVFISFDKNSDILTLSTEYPITLEKFTGGAYKAASDTKIEVEVASSSTAVEGTHFEFTNGKYITVAKNKSKGSLLVKFLKKEAGRDKLVLRLVEKDGYAYGSNASIIISVNGAFDLAGTWSFDQIVNKEWWATSWGEDTSIFPKGTSADQIVISGSSYTDYTFTPSLNGDLRNYFTSAGKITFKEEIYKTYQEDGGLSQVLKKVSVYEFPSVNVNFSTTNSKIRKALVGFRTIMINGQQVLECTIDDYEPTDFLASTYELFKDFGETPIMNSAPLRLHFKRVH